MRLNKGLHKNHNGSFFVLIEKDGDGILIASVPALRGCHTQARDITTLIQRIKEAILLCLEAQKERVRPLKFIGIQEISV